MSIKDGTKRASSQRQSSRQTKQPRKNLEKLIPEITISDQRLQIVIDFMHVHLHQKLSLMDAAQRVKLSTSQVYRLFVNETGLTPVEYLIRLRMQRAERLLSNRLLSIKEVMALTGYVNRGHFIEHFVRYFGTSPSKYRRESRGHNA
jgi:transcriptional regulator GlxA family with amidase domain